MPIFRKAKAAAAEKLAKEKLEAEKLAKEKPKPKVALCLGGGGTRGFGHLGALKAFEEENISFDICVGTSVGSIVGAFYSLGTPSRVIWEYARRIEEKDLKGGLLPTPQDPMKIAKVVSGLIGAVDIESFPKKFAAVAVDLREAKQVILDSGDASIACAASSAVPVIFKPLSYGGRMLVDGGLLNNIPADVCRMLGADKVVTIDVNPTRAQGTDSSSVKSVFKATMSIMMANASVMGLRNSDVTISVDTSEFRSSKMDGFDEMWTRGYEAAMSQIDNIRELFN